MNMQKQKPIWSKILAMLCALALCISMVPAASAARPSTTSNVSKVTVAAKGISEFWTESGETAIGSTGETIGNIRYSFSNSSLVIETTDNTKLPKTITFFAVVNYQPTITSSNDGVSAIASDYGDDWWMITISLANATDSKVTLNAEAVPTYTVTFDENGSQESKGYTLIKVSSDTVKHGESYQFYVIPKTGYQTPEVTVTHDGSALESVTPKDGLYTVANIHSDITIKIGNAQLQKHTVFFPTGTEYTITDANNTPFVNNQATVTHGNTVSFKVTLNNDYTDSDITVYVGGTQITPNNNLYTTPLITDDMTVLVVGVQRNTYQVTWETGTGYSITSNQSTAVEAGGNFTFTVTPAAGYTITQVTANGQALSSKNNQYSITVNQNTTIAVTATATQYPVNVTALNATVEVNNQASYGNLTFTVTPDAGYKVDSVKVNDTSVTADSDGKYTIFVSNDVNIVVTASPVVEITLTTTVTGAGTTVVTVKTSNDWTSGNVEGVKIVGYGTLYSDQTFDPSALKDYIAGRSDSGEYYDASSATVYNYYYDNASIDLSALTGYTFSYKFTSSNSVSANSRYGAGWIELRQGDTKWIITTASAVALS